MVAPVSVRGRAHVVSAGTDFRHIKGDSDELTYALATGLTPIVHRVAGGTQKFFGMFAQDLIELTPKLQVTLSARLDRWRNYNAHNRETTVATGVPAAGDNHGYLHRTSPTRRVSPRAAALYRVDDRVSVWGSVSKGFRAPTLKELYSPFRVGAGPDAIQRDAWPRAADRRRGWHQRGADRALTVRGTWFNNRVNNPIANVTIVATWHTRGC